MNDDILENILKIIKRLKGLFDDKRLDSDLPITILSRLQLVKVSIAILLIKRIDYDNSIIQDL